LRLALGARLPACHCAPQDDAYAPALLFDGEPGSTGHYAAAYRAEQTALRLMQHAPSRSRVATCAWGKSCVHIIVAQRAVQRPAQRTAWTKEAVVGILKQLLTGFVTAAAMKHIGIPALDFAVNQGMQLARCGT
jgi:hypothetical protein